MSQKAQPIDNAIVNDFFDLTDSVDDSDYGSKGNTSTEEPFLPANKLPPPSFETPPMQKTNGTNHAIQQR